MQTIKLRIEIDRCECCGDEDVSCSNFTQPDAGEDFYCPYCKDNWFYVCEDLADYEIDGKEKVQCVRCDKKFWVHKEVMFL